MLLFPSEVTCVCVYVVCAVKDVMYICPFSGLLNGTLTITDYKLHFSSVERVRQTLHRKKKCAIRCCVNVLTHVSVHPQESQFILDINLGAISRLETINVPNLGENTKGLELVCKVCLLFHLWRLFLVFVFFFCLLFLTEVIFVLLMFPLTRT